MDAMLDEKLDVEGFWAQYVGNLTPLEFMNRQYTPDIRACAEAYVEGLPHVFGIVRRQTWKSSFEAPWQFRKGEVMAAIIEKLEATEAEWRPQLNQRPAPEPTPEPVREATPAHAKMDPVGSSDDVHEEAAAQEVTDAVAEEPHAAPAQASEEEPARSSDEASAQSSDEASVQ